MKSKIAVILISALMLLFAVLALWSAMAFIMAPQIIAKLIGAAVIVLVVIGIWTVAKELRFGYQTEKLGGILAQENQLPEDDLPRGRGGKIDREAADAQFEIFRAETEAAPEDWRAWYRLGLGYDASGDRKRARQAMRDAIRLYSVSS